MANVILVDDEKSIRVTLREFLRDAGHEVTTVGDATAALALIRAHDFDVLVTDIVLPRVTGLELLQEVRSESPDLQVILITGEPAIDTAAMAVREGAFDYLSKPFEKSALIRTVERAADIKRLLEERRALERENLVYRENLEQLVEERTRALRDSENRIRAIMDLGMDAILTLDEAGSIQSVNKAAEGLFGYTSEELIGAEISLLMPEPYGGDHKAHIFEFLCSDRNKVDRSTTEKVALRKDGTCFPIELSVGTVELDGATLFTGFIRDLTDKKRAEEEERIRQKELIQADKLASLGVLVSGVSHEINNPNHLVLLGVNQLRDVWKSVEPILQRYYEDNGDFIVGGIPFSKAQSEIPEIHAMVRAGAKRITAIIAELRDYAHDQPSDLDQTVDLNSVVSSATTLLANMLKKSTDHFSMNLVSALPAVQGNRQRLEQVVINLLRNACQALNSREDTLDLITQYDVENGRVVLQVSDSGTGIPPEMLDRIRDPFFTTKRTNGRTGLGLSISSRIVMEHGGTLEFSSNKGKGTCVTVALPVAEVEA